MSYRIGVDIGGTFTDFALLSENDHRLVIHKQLTTPSDPSQSVLSGMKILIDKAGVNPAAVSVIAHGTTLVTNSLIERCGALTGVLCTAGFSDVFDIARERRYDMYDLTITYPEPLAPPHLRREINERIRADGTTNQPLDSQELRKAVKSMIDVHKIEALAICFLNSPTNPAHELQAAGVIAEEFPQLYVSTSADIFPFLREYERWTTTVMNAFTVPMFATYLNRLESGLKTMGFNAAFYIMSSSGGMMTSGTARKYPVRVLESGPAAGVLQSAMLGRKLNRLDLLSYDMGGTTAKGALVRNGEPLKRYEMEVARIHEFKMGSGLPAKIPVIDLIEIGSGGGSIATVDERSTVCVGPLSASAKPGPVCYNQGGEQPTLTDANLSLGYLDASFFLGGEMKLDKAGALEAIDKVISQSMKVSVERAAWGIHESVNEDIARAFRNHASERGFDYRACAMVAFGGSGPAHACRVARKLRVPTVIFPVGAGVMSAIGLLVSPLSFEIMHSDRRLLSELTDTDVVIRFESLIDEASEHLKEAGLKHEEMSVFQRLDMRYQGQGYEIEVNLPTSLDNIVEQLPTLFAKAYEIIFSKSFPISPIEIINWKTEVIGPAPPGMADYVLDTANPRSEAIKGYRPAFNPDNNAYINCPVYDRYTLSAGDNFTGPALVEERESTYVIGDGDGVDVDEHGNLIVSISTQGGSNMKTIDSIDLGIMWNRLTAITDEILISIVRTAFSVGVREAWDAACIIFDAKGRSIGQATLSMPAFIGTAPFTMKHMLERYPLEKWNPGDIVITNDPWLGTGHTPDICIARPIFFQDLLVGFVMTISHLPDVGGVGLSAHNTEIYQEGLILPICKLYRNGQPDETLHELIESNVRRADMVFGDLLANVSGCTVGERLILELMAEYNLSDLKELAEGVIRQSETAIRARIKSIPDGFYENTVQVETVDHDTELKCAITVKDSHIDVDFTGSGESVGFAVNVPLCYTRAFTAYAIKCLTTPRIPNNEGATLPITVTAPEGSILNAQRPSPTGGRHSVGWFIVPLIMGALAEAIPDRVQADAGMASLFIVQGNEASGEATSIQYFLAGGLGAMDGLDGHNTTPSPTNNAVVASEVWENETGMTVDFRRLLVDSGGPGMYRGGLGQVAQMTNTTDYHKTLFLFGMRTKFPAQGYQGGSQGTARRFEVDGKPIPPKGKLVLKPGQIFTVYEAGGGGYGDAEKRDPKTVLADVRKGAVSVEGALRDYGVTVDLAVGTATREQHSKSFP